MIARFLVRIRIHEGRHIIPLHTGWYWWSRGIEAERIGPKSPGEALSAVRWVRGLPEKSQRSKPRSCL